MGSPYWLGTILGLIAIHGFAQEVETPRQPTVTASTELLLHYETIHEKDGKLFCERSVPDMSVEGTPYKISYTVSIPVVENGKTVMRTEQRIRAEIKRPTIRKLVRIDTMYSFVNLNGEEFGIDEIVRHLDGEPKRMLVWNKGRSLPKIWQEFVRSDVIIARIIPTDGDEEISDIVVDDLDALQGLWRGSWGGGQDEQGAIATPVIVELVIVGNQASWHGFRFADGKGVISARSDGHKRSGRFIYAEDSTIDAKSNYVTFTYGIEGESLLLEVDGHEVELTRESVENPELSSLDIRFETASEIDQDGNLIIDRYHQLPTNIENSKKLYTRTSLRSPLKNASIFRIEENGGSSISVSEARKSIQNPTLVAIIKHDSRSQTPALNQKQTTNKDPDNRRSMSEADLNTLRQMLRPGTLVFDLPGSEPQPSP